MPALAEHLAQILEREPMPSGGVEGYEVDYTVGDVPCRGYLARPRPAGRYPAVLVIHDWLGIGDHVRMRADMLARLGYVAFAADLYGVEIRPCATEARDVIGSFFGDPERWHARILGAFRRMLSETSVDGERTGAIGYCFGGASVLKLALLGTQVRAVVSFHGPLPSEPTPEEVSAALLILHGDVDPLVDEASTARFLEQLRGVVGIDWQFVRYSGAWHAFAVPGVDDPDHGARFDPTAERRSWAAMKAFLAEQLA